MVNAHDVDRSMPDAQAAGIETGPKSSTAGQGRRGGPNLVFYTPATAQDARLFERISALDHGWPPRRFFAEAALWAAAAAYAIEYCHERRGQGDTPRLVIAELGNAEALSLGLESGVADGGMTWQDAEEAATMAFVRFHRLLFP